MNAFAFFGQSTINADGSVSVDPTASNGSWAGLQSAFGQAGLLA